MGDKIGRAAGELGQLFEPGIELRDALGIPDDFLRGVNDDLVKRSRRTLVRRTEKLDRLDPVEIEHDAVCLGFAGHENIEHFSAERELSAHGDAGARGYSRTS